MSAKLLQCDPFGWLEGVKQIASPNFDARPDGEAIVLLVVHNISLPPGEFGGDAVQAFFTNTLDFNAHAYYETIKDLRVSAHFLVRRDGAILQFVSCLDRAWHAGSSEWNGRTRCNDFSIGIELEGSDDVPFEDAQYTALARLARSLKAAFPIQDIVGHSDISPGRKTDPGPRFDWARFRALLAT